MAELPATVRATAPRRRRSQWPVVVLAAAALAACFVYASTSGRDRAATSPTEEPAAASDVLVTYVREGGIAGERTRLAVAGGGTATLASDTSGASAEWTRRLSADRLAALRTALEQSGFHNLRPSYRHAGTCNDCIVATVSYRGRSVSVEGSAVPAGLAEVLRLLGELAARR